VLSASSCRFAGRIKRTGDFCGLDGRWGCRSGCVTGWEDAFGV